MLSTELVVSASQPDSQTASGPLTTPTNTTLPAGESTTVSSCPLCHHALFIMMRYHDAHYATVLCVTMQCLSLCCLCHHGLHVIMPVCCHVLCVTMSLCPLRHQSVHCVCHYASCACCALCVTVLFNVIHRHHVMCRCACVSML